jgi:hypothetical protein
MIVVAIAAAIGGLGLAIGPGDFKFGSWLFSIILAPTLGLAIGTGILWLVGKLFSGKAAFMEMFRPLGYAYAPSALAIIPWIGSLVGWAWSMVCAIIAVRESEDVSTGAAAAIVLIPAVIVFILVVILVFIAGMALLGLAKAGS